MGFEVQREPRRIARERKTVEAMIRIACKGRHGTTDGLCPECRELHDFANARLDRCPYQERKPTCSKCLVHCYRPDMREKIRDVMRYAGPRMTRHHPVLTLWHVIDGLRKPIDLRKRQSALRRGSRTPSAGA